MIPSKYLLVGDPHAVADELDDCRRLLECIESAVVEARPEFVFFMGDQHHNHAIIHVEVLAFWREAFQRLAKLTKVVALVGNHDMPGDGVSKSHALLAYKDMPGVEIVDQPMNVGPFFVVPYQHTAEAFRKALDSQGHGPVVLCHQTFDGSKYENGFYAKDGISLEGYQEWKFISGHIHSPQEFANVTYIGAPRWRSLSDAGLDRALALVNSEGETIKLYSTDGYCARLQYLEDREEAPLTPDLKSNWKYIVDIHGSESFIKARKAVWAGCRIRTFKTSVETKKVSESMGIGKALQVFLGSYKPKFGTDHAKLSQMVSERVGL